MTKVVIDKQGQYRELPLEQTWNALEIIVNADVEITAELAKTLYWMLSPAGYIVLLGTGDADAQMTKLFSLSIRSSDYVVYTHKSFNA